MDLNPDPETGIQPRFGSGCQILDPPAVLDQVFFRIISAHTDKGIVNGLVIDRSPVDRSVCFRHSQSGLGITAAVIPVGQSAVLIPVKSFLIIVSQGHTVQDPVEIVGIILGNDQIIPVLAADGLQRVSAPLQVGLETVQYPGPGFFAGFFHIPAGIGIRQKDHDQEPAQGDQRDHAHQYDIEQIDASQSHSAFFFRSCRFQNHTSAADGPSVRIGFSPARYAAPVRYWC